MTFVSPSWRSLISLKGSLNHPKKGTLNHPVGDHLLSIISNFIFEIPISQVIQNDLLIAHEQPLSSGHVNTPFQKGRVIKVSDSYHKASGRFFRR